MLKALIVIWRKMGNRIVKISNRLFLTFFDHICKFQKLFWNRCYINQSRTENSSKKGGITTVRKTVKIAKRPPRQIRSARERSMGRRSRKMPTKVQRAIANTTPAKTRRKTSRRDHSRTAAAIKAARDSQWGSLKLVLRLLRLIDQTFDFGSNQGRWNRRSAGRSA